MEAADGDVEEEVVVACECCGFTEECTARYISVVRARYGGRWICGLCGDAVGEELDRAPISPTEALNRHVAVCGTRRASAPPSPDNNAGDLIAAVRLLLLRRLGSSPRRVRSTPSSPRRSGTSTADVDLAGDSRLRRQRDRAGAHGKLLCGTCGVRTENRRAPSPKEERNLGSC